MSDIEALKQILIEHCPVEDMAKLLDEVPDPTIVRLDKIHGRPPYYDIAVAWNFKYKDGSSMLSRDFTIRWSPGDDTADMYGHWGDSLAIDYTQDRWMDALLIQVNRDDLELLDHRKFSATPKRLLSHLRDS